MQSAFPDPRSLLKKYGLSAKKSWGQNFLLSERVYRGIVDASVSGDDDWVIEVGCGLGTLTMRLAQRVPNGKVIAIEREPDMLQVLEAELAHLDNIEIHPANAMQYDYGKIAKWRGERVSVCGNLPYQIASQIMFRLLEQRNSLRSAVLMIQKEMAQRMVASPGTKAYGVLGVLMATYADIDTIVQAGSQDFSPPPRVDSTVVRLRYLSEPRFALPSDALYSQVVHAAFAQRRKTLRNSLSSQFDKERIAAVLEETELDGKRRGETLTLEEFALLSHGFAKIGDVSITSA